MVDLQDELTSLFGSPAHVCTLGSLHDDDLRKRIACCNWRSSA
jgi:hypothetical protein